jgi:hypothetical protein
LMGCSGMFISSRATHFLVQLFLSIFLCDVCGWGVGDSGWQIMECFREISPGNH